jgi:hypothetical protein
MPEINPDGTPIVTPAPPAIGVPTPAAYTGGEPGWAAGAYDRFKATSGENARLREQLAASQIQAARVGPLEAAAGKAATRHGQDLAMVRMSNTAPNLAHRSVQNAFRRGYADYAENGGTEPFAKWISSDTTKADPLYGVHLQAPAPVTPVAPVVDPAAVVDPLAPGAPVNPVTGLPEPVPVPVPNVDGGVTPDDGTNTGGTYTEAQIGELSKSPAAYAQNAKAIRAQYAAKYGVKLGSSGE